MKILSAAQIKALDAYTIAHEPISSLELMEHAARAFTHALLPYLHLRDQHPVYVICGAGNNGGDGLAVARLLQASGYHVSVWLMPTGPLSPDCASNERRLPGNIQRHVMDSPSDFPHITANGIVVDALFGTGLNRPVSGLAAELIRHINNASASIFSIDIPSGMYADKPNTAQDAIIEATHTFTFHAPKLSFFMPSCGGAAGKVTVLDIGLSKAGEEDMPVSHRCITAEGTSGLLIPKKKFGHKYNFGHACICSGRYGMAGAALLSVRAALRSGAGMVSTQVPATVLPLMQAQNPEAVCRPDTDSLVLSAVLEYSAYDALGIGPGIGNDAATVHWFSQVLKTYRQPMVLDADALNILAADHSLWPDIVPHSILTPHSGEFERLFGKTHNDLQRLELLQEKAKELQLIIILKGAHTAIALPEGQLLFNTTGNPGMAKGGSGDVLTGLLTGLLAQGYKAQDAAVLGVYLHGLAGDIAAEKHSEYSMTATDIADTFGEAYKRMMS